MTMSPSGAKCTTQEMSLTASSDKTNEPVRLASQTKNMASYDNLPLYKATFDLAVYFEKIVKHFDRYHRFTLGQDLRNQSRLIAKQVMRIHQTRNKADANELLAQLEELKLIIRLSKEAKAFHNTNSYGYASELLANICRQAEGWHSHAQKV